MRSGSPIPRKPPRSGASHTSDETHAVSAEDRGAEHKLMGARLREARLTANLGVRELARHLDISASLISQIELGRVVPSVSTLYALTNALNVSIDSLFVDRADQVHSRGRSTDRTSAWPARRTARSSNPDPSAHERAVVQRRHARRAIDLEQDVRWELLTPYPEPGAEFLEVTYPVGGSSSSNDHAIRHNGRDYCLLLEGELSAQIGFEEYVLKEGDSLAFDGTIPHRFWNAGTVPVRSVWFVLDRITAEP